MYLQTARTPHDISAWTLGATLDWQDWRRSLWGAEVRGYWDFYASRWSAHGRWHHLWHHQSTILDTKEASSWHFWCPH